LVRFFGNVQALSIKLLRDFLVNPEKVGGLMAGGATTAAEPDNEGEKL